MVGAGAHRTGCPDAGNGGRACGSQRALGVGTPRAGAQATHGPGVVGAGRPALACRRHGACDPRRTFLSRRGCGLRSEASEGPSCRQRHCYAGAPVSPGIAGGAPDAGRRPGSAAPGTRRRTDLGATGAGPARHAREKRLGGAGGIDSAHSSHLGSPGGPEHCSRNERRLRSGARPGSSPSGSRANGASNEFGDAGRAPRPAGTTRRKEQ